MEPVVTAPVIKSGMLGKLGGGAGGHKNWKERFFVLSDHLYYYESQAAFQKAPKTPLGRVVLNSYFCSKTEEDASFEFQVNAYPKSLTLRAPSEAEMKSWLAALLKPLEDLKEEDRALKAEASSGGSAPAAPGGAGSA